MVRIKDSEGKCEDKENAGQPRGNLDEHSCCLRTENVFRNRRTKRRAQTFAFRALHQNDEHQEDTNDAKNG